MFHNFMKYQYVYIMSYSFSKFSCQRVVENSEVTRW